MTNNNDLEDTRLVRYADVRRLALDMGLDEARKYESESVLQAANATAMHGYRYAERILELFRERLGDEVEVIADLEEYKADMVELSAWREVVAQAQGDQTLPEEGVNESPVSGEETDQEATEETEEASTEGQSEAQNPEANSDESNKEGLTDNA